MYRRVKRLVHVWLACAAEGDAVTSRRGRVGCVQGRQEDDSEAGDARARTGEPLRVGAAPLAGVGQDGAQAREAGQRAAGAAGGEQAKPRPVPRFRRPARDEDQDLQETGRGSGQCLLSDGAGPVVA